MASRAGAGARLGDLPPYHSTDLRGVEIGGAAKNVLAIAAGIVSGRGLGASAAAALTTPRLRGAGRGSARRSVRQAGNAHRPVRSRRPDPHLLDARNRAISRAVLLLGEGLAPRSRTIARPTGKSGRRRFIRVGPQRTWRARTVSICRSSLLLPMSRCRGPGERRRSHRLGC